MSDKREKIKESQLQGFKYFKAISGMLESLHDAGCQRDRAGNRLLHMDQYMSLLLLYMFNPICTSLRAVQQASELQKVQRKLGCPRASLGSLSESARVFDSQLMQEIIEHLSEKLKPISSHSKLDDLPGILTAVDGTLIPALSKMTWALWKTDRFDFEADVIALIFKHRWMIEIFFRFFKHVLGCRHLLSYCQNGIELQTYAAIIACMLIALWTGRKPTLRTYEMLCWYFTGMASEDELLAHIAKLQKQD